MAGRCPSTRIRTRQWGPMLEAARGVAWCGAFKRIDRKLSLSLARHLDVFDDRPARSLRVPLTRSPTV